MARSTYILFAMLTLEFVAPAATSQTQEKARKDLAALNLQFSPEAFGTAAMNGDNVAVNLYLAAGLDPNATTDEGATALLGAASKGHIEIVKLLLDRGANPELAVYGQTLSGFRPLMVAARFGHAETVKLLLERNANPDATNSDGYTALMLAVEAKQIETVKLLVPKTKTLDAKNLRGDTALDICNKNEDRQIGIILAKAGATIVTENAYTEFVSQCNNVLIKTVPEAARALDRGAVRMAALVELKKLHQIAFSPDQMIAARKSVRDTILGQMSLYNTLYSTQLGDKKYQNLREWEKTVYESLDGELSVQDVLDNPSQ